MGWHARYQFLRDTPLTPAELEALVALNAESAATWGWYAKPFAIHVPSAPRADRVIGGGHLQLPLDDTDVDNAALLDGFLHRVLTIAPDSELRVLDDLNAFGWDATKRRISGARRTARPLDLAPDALVDPRTLLAMP